MSEHSIIRNKEDYRRFLHEDQKALGAFTKHPVFSDNPMIMLTDPCWKFQKMLRKLEYLTNCRNHGLSKLYLFWFRKRFQKFSMLLGFSIPPNVFSEGLCIGHYGSIVVSRHAKIGKYCALNSGVNIGGTAAKTAAVIGDYCYMGPGVKIISDVVLGNHVRIGANAVVNKSFPEDHITIAGVPARIVKK